jgi:hypothetical protein
VDILINSDWIRECKGEGMSVYVVRCLYQKIKQDRSETDKTRGETKDNQKNAVEQGRTQCVEVDVRRMMSGNAVECSVSQIEVIQSLTRGEGTK